MPSPFSLALIAPALVWLAASGATAEIRFNCTILKSCDMSGACSGNGQDVAFEFSPKRVKKDGEGIYLLSIGNIVTEAYFFSRVGPIIWAKGDEDVQTMAFGSEQDIVWTASRFDKPAKSRTHFLKCEAQ